MGSEIRIGAPLTAIAVPLLIMMLAATAEASSKKAAAPIEMKQVHEIRVKTEIGIEAERVRGDCRQRTALVAHMHERPKPL